jgi:6-phosphogluconolactonase (cycloisomerase 2 family)
VATIAPGGLATTLTQGTTSITAKVGTVTSTGVTLTATAPVLQSISVTPAGASIPVGGTQTYAVTGNFSDGSHQPVTTGITWGSNPTSVATISTSGVATGVTAGQATITATVGTLPSSSVTLTVTAAVVGNVPRYLFELNADNTISDYAVIPSTGQLRSVSYVGIPPQFVEGVALNSASPAPVMYLAQQDTTTGVTQLSTLQVLPSGFMILVGAGTTANLSGALAVDPQGRYLYAADNTDQQISLFTLDPVSGLPTAGTGLPITVGATELTIDPAGAFLYMEDGSGGIHSYQIGAGGALTPVGTPPSSHPLFGRQALVVDPSGSFLLAVDAGSQNFLYEYSISAGALTPVAGSPFPIGGFGGDISELAFDPAASFLYAIDSSNDQLLGFAFSGSGLTPIAGSPFAVPASGVPKSINVDPSGKHVFVSYTLTGEVWTYSIASGGSSPGALTPVSKMRLHSSFELGQLLSTGTAAVTFTPKQLLVANEETPGATITQFTIDPATGNLSPLSTPIGAGDTAKTVATDPFGANAYAPAFTSDAVFGYTDIFGVGLSFYATEPYAAGNGPSWLTTDLSGSFLYVTMQTDNTVWKYDLPLQPASGAATISTHAGPVFVTTDPTGSFIYVADGTAATIDVFGIDSATGNLGPIAGGSVTQGLSQNWIAFDPSGRFAYSADPQFNAVWEFTIGTTGALTLNSTSHVSLGPVSSTPGASSVVVEPTGNFLYATNEVMGQIYAFSIDPSTGLLTQVPTSMSNGQAANTDPSPTGLAVDISGKFLYCVSAGATAQTASIDIFSIDLTTGLLTPVATVPNVAFAAGCTTTGLLQ